MTDFEWYDFLAARALPEVNFWTPSDRRPFAAPEFSPFLFKLKARHRAIADFGYFARWSSLPDWLAWECFGDGNGCESLAAMEARIAEIRERIGYVASAGVPQIGCILIVQPSFFPRDAWIAQPAEWCDRTVPSKSHDRRGSPNLEAVPRDGRPAPSQARTGPARDRCRLREDFSNGRSYYPLHGSSASTPRDGSGPSRGRIPGVAQRARVPWLITGHALSDSRASRARHLN